MLALRIKKPMKCQLYKDDGSIFKDLKSINKLLWSSSKDCFCLIMKM